MRSTFPTSVQRRVSSFKRLECPASGVTVAIQVFRFKCSDSSVQLRVFRRECPDSSVQILVFRFMNQVSRFKFQIQVSSVVCRDSSAQIQVFILKCPASSVHLRELRFKCSDSSVQDCQEGTRQLVGGFVLPLPLFLIYIYYTHTLIYDSTILSLYI